MENNMTMAQHMPSTMPMMTRGHEKEKIKQMISEVYERQKDGVEFHTSMVDLFAFLHLKGFQMWQEYRLKEETEKLHEIQQRFIKRHHGMLGPHRVQQYSSIIPPQYYGHSAKDINKEDIMRETKRSLREYLNWEEQTLDFYKKKQRELVEIESYAEYIDLREMIEDVAAEIEFLETLMIELESVNYDPSYIMKLQERFCVEFDTDKHHKRKDYESMRRNKTKKGYDY